MGDKSSINNKIQARIFFINELLKNILQSFQSSLSPSKSGVGDRPVTSL